MHCSWEEFYPGTQPYNRIKYSSKPVSQNNEFEYYASHCIFFNLKRCAIIMKSNSLNTLVLIEDTLYSKCFNHEWGGSIVLHSYGKFTHNRICSYKSGSNSSGIFCYFSFAANKFHYKILESSISSSKYYDKGDSTLFCYGPCNISYINSSGNKAIHRSLFSLIQVYQNSKLLFSTFANNTNTGDKAYDTSYIWDDLSTSFFIQRCNFLNNVGANHKYGTFLWASDSNVYISYCSFHGNTRHGFSFNTQDGHITVENCYITDKINNHKCLTLRNNIQYKYTYFYRHFSAHDCTAENPPIYSNKEETQIPLYSCYDMYTFFIFYASCE